ncbi:hypothetical protein RQM47_09390 [Rubrivirga sp. S365]|uniref:Uncharacterized protein n=1 Tax=Rubrivirga litoralis TaxID=3075598 RepID=A0ABU3BMM1_9BACT|nr:MULTISPECIES: hypothetical protein [unclassified Rubrivirga]MDT0630532.1 hypothetical protein [Rubrivirga sp. F394]MDT7856853.1 hypothetical protein [Rubrivirga sp. S365]
MYDDFDDDAPGAPLDPETVAALDGAAADAFAQRKARLTRVLVEGETGVQFESLALFAEPLFALYGLDAADAFRLRAEPDAVADDAVALLETARVLWAFLSMPPADRAHQRASLAAQLVGEDPSEEDWMGLDGLLETAEIHWQALLPEEVEMAQETGHETLDFEALLHHPAFRVGPEDDDATHAGFGEGSLSEIEARALFAQPLLDDPATQADADAFETALARADDYWALAQSAGDDADAAAAAFAREHADGDEAALRDEARRMIARFRELFPEHAGQ